MQDFYLLSKQSLSSLKSNNYQKQFSGSAASILTAILFSSVYNARVWNMYFTDNSISSVSDILQAVCFFLFITAFLLTLFSLTTFRWLQKPVLSLLFIICAPCVYFSLSLGVYFDTTMLQNVFETDSREILDLLTTQFWFVFIFLGVIPSIFIFKINISYTSLFKQAARNMTLFSVAIAIGLASIFPYYGELSFFVRNNNTAMRNSLLPTAPIRAVVNNIVSISNERISG